MIATGGDKHGAGTDALCHLKTEYSAIKVERTLEVGDFQMNVADACRRINRMRTFWIHVV
jgi:hypothetical protein